jgi:diguanylate cyclase (GGDEF)-like protein
MPDDARLVELQVLSELERKGTYRAGPFNEGKEGEQALQRLLIHLLKAELAIEQSVENDASARARIGFDYQHRLEIKKWDFVLSTARGSAVTLGPTHAGAVRRAELEQQLKTGRIKEPFGIIWDGRHFRQDMRIALLDASAQRPLAVAYLDLNDVKQFNAKSHATGDEAIKRYLEIIADVISERGDGRYGEAYRLSGGADEVVILLQGTNIEQCCNVIEELLAELGKAKVVNLTLRAAAGLVAATDPSESVDALKDRADKTQLRAKDESRRYPERPSIVACWEVSEMKKIPTPQ